MLLVWKQEELEPLHTVKQLVSVFRLHASRLVMTGNSLVRWNGVGEKAQHCFGRSALPMLWDFAEPNFLGTATGCIDFSNFLLLRSFGVVSSIVMRACCPG